MQLLQRREIRTQADARIGAMQEHGAFSEEQPEIWEYSPTARLTLRLSDLPRDPPPKRPLFLASGGAGGRAHPMLLALTLCASD
jgi:hypothetical protein